MSKFIWVKFVWFSVGYKSENNSKIFFCWNLAWLQDVNIASLKIFSILELLVDFISSKGI